ncbi:MAG: DoxX family protein [Gemmatimonadetes bacterium]|nr:DoxX family protein [Gemmatimonadota bacterium]
MVWLGILGLMKRDFVQVWQPVPKGVPLREALAYFTALISLGGGIGLLVPRTARIASRVLFATLLAWLAVLRFPFLFFQHPLVLVAWTFGGTAVMVAGAWVLYVRHAGDADRARLGGLAGDTGIRIAHVLYGISFIPFGLAHFMYLDNTTVLIPAWLPWHVAWAYFTGATFIAAGLAVALGVLARLAATLSAVQMGLFLLIVWLPRVFTGQLSEFQRGEVVTNCALLAAAWVVVESFRARD